MSVYKQRDYSNNISLAGGRMEKEEVEEFEGASFTRQFRLGEFSEHQENPQ